MSRDIRRKLEEQRAGESQAKDLLQRSFERHQNEKHHEREQADETRKQRALQYWKEASNESKEK
jgi:hypothetical protein